MSISCIFFVIGKGWIQLDAHVLNIHHLVAVWKETK